MPETGSDAAANQSDLFWDAVAPPEHLVQICDDEAAFLDSLEGFVAGGLRAGDGVVVIATAAHRKALEDRLCARDIYCDLSKLGEQYVACDAEEVLAGFMVDDWPDEARFERAVSELLQRAGGNDGRRRVRAFGEMVALLWRRGQTDATMRLEQLWHRMCHERGFSLFCAYPKSCFAHDAQAAIKGICAAHSKVVPAA